MIPGSLNFSLHALEARFEMQSADEFIADPDGGGHGGAYYDYYGDSWGDLGKGEGYVGVYEMAADGSGAMLDDGTFTDGSSGAFPAYDHPDLLYRPEPDLGSKCVICRC
jgi:hypothetical protein